MSEELISSKFNIKTKFLWHSTQIYCLAFDRNGKYIFTGGDDGVLRVYSIAKDRLMRTLTDENTNEFVKAVEEVCHEIDFQRNTDKNMETLLEKYAICDITVNHENSLVAAGKHNGTILVWNLQTFDLMITFQEQIFPIRSIVFSPVIFDNNKKYLISCSEDGFVFFYVYNYKTLKFEAKSGQRKSKFDGERALNICLDFTSGGLLLGVIHTFGVKQVSKPKSKKEPLMKSNVESAIRVFSLTNEMGLKEEWKTTYHKKHSDCVYSLRFSHNTFRFASACDKDTNAFIWTFDKSNKKWDSIIIGINTKGDTKKLLRGKSKQSIEEVFVEEILFSCDDKYMITVLTDISIKVWNSESGELIRHFDKHHSEKISVVDCHPTYGHIFVSAGYDSNVFIYDITKGTILQHFECSLNSRLITDSSIGEDSSDTICVKPLLLQCNFSPDGNTIAVTDNYGNLTVLSLESRQQSYCLDQLEEVLFRMHSESDEESCLPQIGINLSEDKSHLIQEVFEYESELLRGIERPSPLRQSQKREDKKIDLKSVKKLDFETESNNRPKIVKSMTSCETKTKTSHKKTQIKKSSLLVEVNSPKETEKTSKSKPSVNAKQKKFTKEAFKQILDEIFENPSSRPFHINDEIQYPTYRKEISDADLSLTSIKEDMLLNNRYSFAKFNKDMNKVIENAKSFYKHNDEEVYEMALMLEKFYCNKMSTLFGTNFKHPNNFDSSDDSISDISDETPLSKPVPKNQNTSNLNEDNDSDIESDSNLKSNSKQSETTPKINGKKTPKGKSPKDESLYLKNSDSNRKRIINSGNNGSDSESTTGKRTKTINCSQSDDKEEQTRHQINNDIREESPKNDKKISKTSNNLKDVILDNHLEDRHSIDSQNELTIDLGENKDQKEKEGSVSKPESSVNGNPKNETTCDVSQNQLKNCLFCIFCDKIFWTITETKCHYIHHLCPLKCSKCKSLFNCYDEYLIHDCGHPKTPENLVWCRHYSDSINWIEKFVDFQQTEDIESFHTFSKNNNKCIVCEKVHKFRPESKLKTKIMKSVDESNHLEKHMKYSPQFQCLICLLDYDKYFYCRNSGETAQHLSKEHPTLQIKTSDPSLQYFDGSIPLLDQILLQFHS